MYPHFIGAVADLSLLRLRWPAAVVLSVIISSALLAILGFAGLLKELVSSHRWIMYSLFIGLTLGGVPLIWRMARPLTNSVYFGAVIGFLLLAAMAFISPSGSSAHAGFLLLFLAGLAGAAAMVLPGVSGGYLLLLLGQYEIILDALDHLKLSLIANGTLTPDLVMLGTAMEVVVPVGCGVAVGIIGVSNLLKWLLSAYEKVTLGLLLGLLLGAVVGLWPFQYPSAPQAAETSVIVYFVPDGRQLLVAGCVLLAGFGITWAIARIGRSEI